MEINIFPEQPSSNEVPSGQETNLSHPEIQIHQLPCSINYNGKAKIENYFVVNALDVKTNQNMYASMDMNQPNLGSIEPLYETFFRGRRLIGKRVMLDDKHEGCIFKESSYTSNKPNPLANGEIEETRSWETSHKFHSFMVWEHDTVPLPSNNRLLNSLDWLEIANVVHEPTSPDS
ncbi:ribonuclease H2 non-catalytic subunit-domain-containing protein [Gigaspora rosea]|uniref:Ribonuclease H2 non-catalytic subunit-domain-containing protein n=1 Tax=Gigaspora rosea TaxID=44941 RepID=A0A397UET4_9GLOM|nr:ribonuclease H2 non-catalytic subunit-domain-containing protein [Gigaspora rosea]CAG8571794.1 21781_t:CDS:2 [Gigaspora rosea]